MTRLGIRWYALRCAVAHALLPRDLRTPTWKLWVALWEAESRMLEQLRDEIRAERAMGIVRREKAEHN